ncbi:MULTISPECIES: heparinase II/III domain-containing protein [unclassified Enterococcus]|uniref:heparinase II/III domain-containing protein n=1 Tax=unclassified Enterococcus TaxID=2608891 RepID=UPI001A9AF7D0|nr:heparinase II/III family protein [Enterococcus sp. DIV1271a]MBO1300948.1 heparinase II/III family protein [Enterococcus sp. DIV1271a]
MKKRFLMQLLEAKKEYLVNPTVPNLPVSGYRDFLRTGERLSFETAYFARRKQVSVLTLSLLQQKEVEVIEKLEQVLWEICNEYSWSLPAHLPIEGDHFRLDAATWIDLFAAETGQMLAEIVSLFSTELSETLTFRIRTEVAQRLFVPLIKETWSFESLENNWSAVIGGSIGMAALDLLERNAELQKEILVKVDRCVQSYLRSFGNDGACEEGISYWAYGFGYYCYFAEKYQQVYEDDRYLSDDKVKRIAAFPFYVMIDEKEGVPFSDYHPAELPSGLLSFCHERFRVEIPEIKAMNELDFDHCYRFAPLLRNLLWTKQYNGDSSKEIFHFFDDVAWGVLQSAKENLVFTAKGGRNDESHNHLDIGHFIFGTKETLFLTDLGAGEYTKDYFDEKKRYRFLVNNALGHSVPIIADAYQLSGTVSAENTSFQRTRTGGIFKTELTHIYPRQARLLQMERTLEVDRTKRQLVLKDVFVSDKENQEVVENFITTHPVEVREGTVCIVGEKEKCEMLFSRPVQLIRQTYFNHYGQEVEATLIQATYQLERAGTIQIECTITSK